MNRLSTEKGIQYMRCSLAAVSSVVLVVLIKINMRLGGVCTSPEHRHPLWRLHSALSSVDNK